MKKLPKNVKIKAEQVIDSYTLEALGASIGDYLSDKYGFCHNGFNYDVEIKVSNIEWDTEEQ